MMMAFVESERQFRAEERASKFREKYNPNPHN